MKARKALAFLTFLLVLGLLSACAQSSGKGSETPGSACTVSVTGAGGSVILAPTKVPLGDGESVLDVLKRVTKEQNMQMEYSGTEKNAYVKGIGSLYEFDKGPGSGWIFFVNDATPSVGCGEYTLKTGDVIKWMYTENMGKDLGAASGIPKA